MMTDLNTRYFAGKQVVTCYTCHNGRRAPAATPFLPITKPLEPGEMEARAKLPMPPVQQILDRYIEALGGEQSIRRVTNRVITGMQYIPTGPGGQTPAPATIERAQKAPNLIVNTYKTATFTIADGFDGRTSWSQNQQGRTADAIEVDQPRARRDADFYFPLNLKQHTPTMTVEGIDRVSDRDAYVVVATPQGEVPERLYFDTQTGLLLRKATALPTQIGFSPFQVNYSDYRDAGNGVKVPYADHDVPCGVANRALHDSDNPGDESRRERHYRRREVRETQITTAPIESGSPRVLSTERTHDGSDTRPARAPGGRPPRPPLGSVRAGSGLDRHGD